MLAGVNGGDVALDLVLEAFLHRRQGAVDLNEEEIWFCCKKPD
jgi:hypothetical protein